MMSKKNLNVLLIFLMLIIWILVFNKFFKFNDSEPETINSTIDSNSPTIYTKFSKDTFDLKRIEKDPFLGNIKKQKRRAEAHTAKINSSKLVPNRRKILAKKDDKLIWPKVSYFGRIKSVNSSSELILIKIDNKLYKLRQGEKQRDVVIRKVYRDSIKVKMENDFKTVLKQK